MWRLHLECGPSLTIYCHSAQASCIVANIFQSIFGNEDGPTASICNTGQCWRLIYQKASTAGTPVRYRVRWAHANTAQIATIFPCPQAFELKKLSQSFYPGIVSIILTKHGWNKGPEGQSNLYFMLNGIRV